MNVFLILFVGFLSLSSDNTEIFTVDGVVHEGRIVAFEPGGELQFEKEAGETESIEITDVHLIQFPIPVSSGNPETPAFIKLVDQSLLAGEVRGGNEEGLLFMHPLLGSLNIPIDGLSVLVSDSPAMPQDLAPYPETGDDDILYKRGTHKRGKDYIQGTLVEFTAQGVVFDCRLGELSFRYDELEAISLVQDPPSPSPAGLWAWVVLQKGTGVLRARIQSFGRKELVVATDWAGNLSIPYEKIGSVTLEGLKYQALSDLKPLEVEERSYIAGDKDRFLYPHLKDRSVTGRWLVSGNRIFARGLGVHSRTRLAYRLDDRYRAFETHIGLSDEVQDLPAQGSIRLDVFVDDANAYSSPVIRGGEGVLRIPRIDLTGAQKLELVIDFADHFDSGDRAVLGNPVLIGKNASSE